MASSNALPRILSTVIRADTADPEVAIRLRGARVAYDRRLALEDVSIEVRRGQLVSVIGPNGSGKSTLLKAIVGLAPLAGGSIEVVGPPARRRGASIAYMPQHEVVHWEFPVLVEDVVMMGRYPRIGWLRRPGKADRAVVQATLQRLGMWERRRSQIAQLSGGQQQRVFLARALAQETPVILMDEPLTGVDASSETVILDVARALAQSGHTVVMATHDLAQAEQTSDTVICLNRRLIAYGPPAQTFAPAVLTKTYGGPVILAAGHGIRHGG